MLNHWYHHRGQLLVYLRLLDVPVPSVYGPTADENPFAAAMAASGAVGNDRGVPTEVAIARPRERRGANTSRPSQPEQEEHERGRAHDASRRVKTSPPFEQLYGFVTPRIESRVEQLLVGRQNHDKRERYDSPEKNRGQRQPAVSSRQADHKPVAQPVTARDACMTVAR